MSGKDRLEIKVLSFVKIDSNVEIKKVKSKNTAVWLNTLYLQLLALTGQNDHLRYSDETTCMCTCLISLLGLFM